MLGDTLENTILSKHKKELFIVIYVIKDIISFEQTKPLKTKLKENVSTFLQIEK